MSRSTRPTRIVVAAAAAIVAAGATALVARTADGAGTLGASPQAGPSAQTARRMPGYLPAGAALVKDHYEPDINGWLVSYSLPGRANSNTIDEATFAGGTGHPETFLRLAIVPSADQFPAADPAYFTTRQVEIGAFPGRLSVPTSGYGLHSIVWFDGEQAYRVSVDRLRTPDGTSGVRVEELLRVAASIR